MVVIVMFVCYFHRLTIELTEVEDSVRGLSCFLDLVATILGLRLIVRLSSP